MRHTVYLSLGSSQGDRAAYLKQAINHLGLSCGFVSACSPVYESDAWGFQCENRFLNLACTLETALAPKELLSNILVIEQKMGRIRDSQPGYQSRNIDIDILFISSLILQQPELTLPHPRMHERRFVLLPLNDIAPEAIHPVADKSISQLLAECKDPLNVIKTEIVIL